MMAGMEQKEALRKELLELNQKRTVMEKDLKGWQDVLSSQKVGMSESLVDSEGFPRNDIDVYQVRTARNKIVCAQNDLRELMKKIEIKLFEFHALNPVDANPPSR